MIVCDVQQIDELSQRANQFEALMAALTVVAQSGDLPSEHMQTLMGLAGDMAIGISTATQDLFSKLRAGVDRADLQG